MENILVAISVWIVFLTYWLNMLEGQVTQLFEKERPVVGPQGRIDEYNNEAKKICGKLIFITMIYVISFYILLPETVNIVKNSSFSLWNFDASKTIFVLIEAGLLGLAVYAAKLIYDVSKNVI